MTTARMDEIRQAFVNLQAGEKHIRARDAATRLGVTEAALIARLTDLGPVIALTRNEHAVHERHGVYADVRRTGSGHILVLGPGINLRLFPSQMGTRLRPGWSAAIDTDF